jgi:hypothetical protein
MFAKFHRFQTCRECKRPFLTKYAYEDVRGTKLSHRINQVSFQNAS